MPAADITPRLNAGRQLIESYGGGGFKISGNRHAGSIVVVADSVAPWLVAAAGDVTTADVMGAVAAARALTDSLTILVIGCGQSFVPPPPTLTPMLRTAGIAPEWMTTGAACRTYNVLLLEGRSVAAALLAID